MTGLPAGFAIDSSGVITGTFASNASHTGSFTVTISVNDGEGGSTVKPSLGM